jgi:hypothetical protein
MRYSRLKKRRTRQRYAAFLIVVFLMFTGVYMFSAGYAGKLISQIVSSIMNSIDKEVDGPQGDETNGEDEEGLYTPETPGNADEEISKITEQLTIESTTFFAIQMDAFNTQENAETRADEIKKLGGAGYIVHDKYYRVLAIVFMDEASANNVKEQLKIDNIESQIYKIMHPKVNMNVTATKEKVNVIKSAFSLWQEKMRSLEQLILDLDSNKISVENTKDVVAQIKSDVEKGHSSLQECTASQESTEILNGLIELYNNGLDSLNQIINENSINLVAISSKIKYTYIDMVYKFNEYIKRITSV